MAFKVQVTLKVSTRVSLALFGPSTYQKCSQKHLYIFFFFLKRCIKSIVHFTFYAKAVSGLFPLLATPRSTLQNYTEFVKEQVEELEDINANLQPSTSMLQNTSFTKPVVSLELTAIWWENLKKEMQKYLNEQFYPLYI